jgi:hypothetical protein
MNISTTSLYLCYELTSLMLIMSLDRDLASVVEATSSTCSLHKRSTSGLLPSPHRSTNQTLIHSTLHFNLHNLISQFRFCNVSAHRRVNEKQVLLIQFCSSKALALRDSDNLYLAVLPLFSPYFFSVYPSLLKPFFTSVSASGHVVVVVLVF